MRLPPVHDREFWETAVATIVVSLVKAIRWLLYF